MIGAGLSKEPVRRPRTTCGASPRTRRRPLLAASALVLGSLAVTPPAHAANVTSTAFTGGAGTWTSSATGKVYARQGAVLSLQVGTTGNTQCVEVVDGSGAVVARQGRAQATNSWTFTGEPWLVAGSGNGTKPYTAKAYSGWNRGQDLCTSTGNETFTTQQVSYVLDNAAPTATASLSPAPNGAGWNRSDVTLTWTGADADGSGVASVSPASATVTAEGVSPLSTKVTDNLGNSATSAPV